MRTWANVAEILNTKSLQGKLVVRSAPGFPFLLQPGMEVAVVPPSLDVPRKGNVASVQHFSDEKYLIELDSVSDIGTAKELKGRFLLVKRSMLDIVSDLSSEHPWIGYSVEDESWGHLGVVEQVNEGDFQDLVVVVGKTKEILIPCVDVFISEVDEEQRQLLTNIPEGLLDLSRSLVDSEEGDA